MLPRLPLCHPLVMNGIVYTQSLHYGVSVDTRNRDVVREALTHTQLQQQDTN